MTPHPPEGAPLRAADAPIGATDAPPGAEEARRTPVALLDGLEAIVWQMDPATWRFTFVSAGAERVLGFPRAQWLDEPDFWRAHLHPDDRQRAVAYCADRVAHLADHELEYRMVAADGHAVWLHNNVHVSNTSTGVELHGVMFDVSRQHELLAQLRASEERFARFAEASVDGVVVHEGGRIVDVNDACTAIFGYAREDLLGRDVTSLADPGTAERLRAHIQAGSEAPLQGMARRRSGEAFPAEVRARNVRTGRGPARLVVVRDLSEVRRAERALQDAERQLQQSRKLDAIGRLAGGIAHDFNNLITVITTYTQMVASRLSAGDPRYADLGEVQQAARRAGELVRQLLAFSRRQAMQPESLDLNRVVRGMEQMMRRVIGEDVRIDLLLTPGEARIRADRAQVEEVLMNLLVNARDAMPQGGTVQVATAVRDMDADAARAVDPGMVPGRYVALTVHDSGVGMVPEVREHVFEPFFSTKPAAEGSGLGLAAVHGIVNQSGGHITLDSEPGRGTRFCLFFPEEREGAPAPASPASATPELPPPATPGARPTVLLVEDEASVREVTRRVLEQSGYRVLAAKHAEEALTVARFAGRIDLLLTDLVMPGLGGRELAERLVARQPGLPVLFMSGYTGDDVRRRGQQLAGQDVLAKPFTVEDIVARVRAALDAAVPIRPT